MTTTPPQPPQNQYPGQPTPGGYGPPQDQFPQYAQPPAQPEAPQYGGPQHGDPQYGAQQYGAQQYDSPPQQAPAGYGQHPGGPQYAGGPQFGPEGQQYPGGPQYGQQQFPSMAPVNGLQCRFCGAVPAVKATVRGHQGLIILMRFLKLAGPFCKTCGTAAVRDMTARSMVAGWWGIGSSIVNPITMLMNLGPASKFRNLPEPAPGAPGRPMDPGKPLFKRPQVLGLLVPVALIGLLIFANLGDPSSAEAGDCVRNKGTSSDPNVKVVDCASADAEYKVLGKVPDEAQCDQYEGATVVYTEERGSSSWTLCLAPNN